MIRGHANNTPTKFVIDNGSVITVFRRGHLPTTTPLKRSKLQMKGVTGTGKLYGPHLITFEFPGFKVQFPAYEADIEDDCLLGNDFQDYFDCAVESAQRRITIRRLSPTEVLSKPIQIPCEMAHSATIGSFHAGRVFYVARAGKALTLAPLSDAVVTTELEIEEYFPNYQLPNQPNDGPKVRTNQTKIKKGTTNNTNTHNHSQMSPEDEQVLHRVRLGLITQPVPFDQGPKPSRLGPNVLTMSGVIPCAKAPVQITIQNVGDQTVQIPKYAVLAEVYPLTSTDFDLSCTDGQDEGTVPVHCSRLETKEANQTKLDSSHPEVDCDPIPRADPIPENQPLPEDIEDLIQRCKTIKSEAERTKVRDLHRKHHDVFAKDNTTFGRCPWVKFTIDTGDHPPIKLQARPIPLHYRKAVYETFMKYLECGAVRPSQSAWASPILCVPKKTGEIRVCIDYRALNHITKVPAIPIPFISELTQKLAGRKIYHSFDLAHGYHNLEIDEKDIPKTAVILPEDLGLPARQLEWTRLSFGLSAAPGIFQQVTDRLMRQASHPTPENDVGPHSGVYLDDICVAGDTFEEMLSRLEALYNRVRASGFFLKAKKCSIFQDTVEYLGHTLSAGGIGTMSKKVQKVLCWPTPQNVAELGTFLGKVNYYTKFVPHLATVAAPLNALLHKDKEWHWTEECEKSFQELKRLLADAPVLGTPDLTKGKFILYSDASLTGLGGVLKQDQDGREITLSHWSKTLNQAQRNYCVTHRELLALVEAVEHFHHYLAGAPFLVKTDHSALQWLRNFKNPSGLLARWLSRLAPYKFEVQYIKGKDNIEADALSRKPPRPCSENCKKCTKLELQDQIVNLQTIRVFWTTIAPDPDFSPQKLRQDQLLDEDMMPIMIALQEGVRPPFQEIVGAGPKTRSLWLQYDSLVLHDGVMYRCIEHPSLDENWRSYQLVIPAKRVKDIVISHHSNAATGNHFGAKKTYMSLKKIFYWPGMWEDTLSLILQCEQCARIKHHKRYKTPLKIFREGVLHGKWHIDICGPLQKSSPEGYNYILVAVEAFSGWPFAIPIKTKSSQEIAEVLVRDVFSIFGSPLAILSDQEKCLTSALIRDIQEIYGIKGQTTALAHPAANGKAEKWIQTLENHIAILVEKDQKNWPKLLPLICQAYRSTPHTATKFSPYEVIFGAPMRTPLDLKRGLPPGESVEINSDYYPFWLRKILEEIHAAVRQNHQEAAHTMKRYYDLHTSVAPFKAGDLVWLHNPKRIKGRTPKLDSPWEGPYLVVRIINDTVAAIKFMKHPFTMRIVHLDKLASYHAPAQPVQAAWLHITQSPWQQVNKSSV